jgi:hypothetical protein
LRNNCIQERASYAAAAPILCNNNLLYSGVGENATEEDMPNDAVLPIRHVKHCDEAAAFNCFAVCGRC